jgi:hypothetical protein
LKRGVFKINMGICRVLLLGGDSNLRKSLYIFYGRSPKSFNFFLDVEKIAIKNKKEKTISDVPQNPVKFKVGQKSPHLPTFLLIF